MHNCLCIKHDIPISRLSPHHCNYTCENNADDVYSADCGGEVAYNIYETQGGIINILWWTCTTQRLPIAIRIFLLYFLSFLVMFDAKERCLSLQCFEDEKRFIPQKCSNLLDKVCANMSEFFFY